MALRDHKSIVINKFNGLWDQDDIDSTPQDHFSECNNIRYVGMNSFNTRWGISTSQDVDAPLQNIKRIYNYPLLSGNTLIILTYDYNTDTGAIYHLIDSTTVFGPLLSIVGMTDFAFTPFAGRAYISPFNLSSPTSNPPSAAIVAMLTNGTDVDTGVHGYGITGVTASGETTVSPLATVTTNTVALANPVIAPVVANIGVGGNNLVAGGSYKWKFVYSTDSGATLLTLPGPASNTLIAVSGQAIGLNISSSFPTGAVLVGVYRTINGGSTYYLEFPFTFSTNIPNTPGNYELVGITNDTDIINNPVAPSSNTTTTGDVNLSQIPPVAGNYLSYNIYRTPANSSQLKLLASGITGTTFADTFADSTLGVDVPTQNTATLPGVNISRGLSGEFLYVYQGDGTPARKAAGIGLTGSMTIANGSGATDLGLHIFGVVSETISGYLTPPAILTQFTTNGQGVSFGNIPTSGDPNVIARFLVSSITIPTFNGNLDGYQLFFIPNAVINNNSDTFLNNVSFYDADLLEDASHLSDNYDEIPAGAVLNLYHGRLCLGATYDDINLMLVSQPGEPEAISQIDGIISVYPDSNPITNCAEMRDVLYITKATKTFAYSDNGDTPSTWVSTVIDLALGSFNHGIATVLNSGSTSVDFLIIATYQGINLFNGRYITPELTWKIYNYWQDLDRTSFNLIQIINNPINKILYIVLPNGKMLMGDYANGLDPMKIRWSPWSFLMSVNTIGMFGINELVVGADIVS